MKSHSLPGWLALSKYYHSVCVFSIRTYKAIANSLEPLVYTGDAYARELNINMEALGKAQVASLPCTASSGSSTLGDSQGYSTNT